jgi:transposase
MEARRNTMAYMMTKNVLKSGDTIFYINTVSRVPGEKSKLRQVMVEKFSANELMRQGKENPEAYVRERLNGLREESRKTVRTMSYQVDFGIKLGLSGEGDLRVSDDCKNLGFAAYSRLYHRLELDEFINNRRRYLDCGFNINVIFQHLVYSRLLWPASKKSTWEHKDRFFGDTGYGLQDVYRSMDSLLKWRTDLLRHLDGKIKEKFGRRDTVVFYDVTNYYFELDKADDENGLRAKGESKEHRPEPIIQMGLFMDELSLPITYELFRGNTNDCETLPKAMEDSIIDFADSRKIVVADKGMLSYYNIMKIRDARNGYVISQSIRKSDSGTKRFALSAEGWQHKLDGDGNVVFMMKERTIPRKATTHGDVDDSSHCGTYNERQVFIWSKKYSDRAKYDRQAVIEKAKEFEGRKSKDFKDSNYGKSKYLRKSPVKAGAPVEPDGCIYEFDAEKLKEDEKYDGYYLICTNVVGVEDESGIDPEKPGSHAYYRDSDGFLVLNHVVPTSEIADIYGGLWKIEETFKVTKTGMLSLRPVFHSNQDRIRAHFLICFISLVLERLLELQLGWQYSAKSIQESLSSFNALQLANSNIYQVSYYDVIVDTILKTLGIDISRKFLQQSDIRKIIGQTKKKDYED